MASKEVLKVAINARVTPGGSSGGVEQVIIGLVSGLGQLDDGDEEYLIVVHPDYEDWLRPYLGANERTVPVPRPHLGWKQSVVNTVKKVAPDFVLPVLRTGWRYLSRDRPNSVPTGLTKSDGFFESLGVDVIHFPYQSSMVLCSIPGIYNPHDLQHLHYPQFFPPEVIASREAVYPACCRYAQAVAVASQWVKDDIVKHYGIEPEKIFVIPLAAPTGTYGPVYDETPGHVQQKYSLPQTFALYPAQTWAHKNHIRLLEAMALLRDQHSLTVNLVCTGRKSNFWPSIAERIRELGLENQVQVLGFVSPRELKTLYRMAQFVIIPTLFEAASGPVYEAFQEEVPVACSTVTSLPEQAGNAALLFDPMSVEDIAKAMYQMATDKELRATLRRRGKERIRVFTWERTARAYRALYRKVAGRALSNDDEVLLSTDWMRMPLGE